MKKLIPFLILLVITGMVIAGGTVVNFTITPAVTTVSANSTNTTAGTTLLIANPIEKGRLYVSASGIAATTNGLLTIYFSTASGNVGTTNTFDDASTSLIKLSMTNIGANTMGVSDWFELSGVKYIRVGRIENTQFGVVSNISINLSHASP